MGQGEIVENKGGTQCLDRSVLGRNEVYTVVLGNSSHNLSKVESDLKLKKLIAQGYSAKKVEIDPKNQRYVLYVGKFDSYMKVQEEMKKLNSSRLPAFALVISNEVASTYLSRDGKGVKKVIDRDPLKEIINTNRRGAVSDEQKLRVTSSASGEGVKKQTTTKVQIERKNLITGKKIAETASPNGGNVMVSLSRPVSVARLDNNMRKSEAEAVSIEEDEDLALDEEEEKQASNSDRVIVPHGKYKLQLATFGSMKYAANYQKRLEKDGFSPVKVKKIKSKRSGKTWYVVRIEGFGSRGEASEFVDSVLKKYDSKVKPLILK